MVDPAHYNSQLAPGMNSFSTTNTSGAEAGVALRTRALVAAGCVLIGVLTRIYYFVEFQPLHAYILASLFPQSAVQEVFNWALALIPLWWLPLRIERPSQVMCWIIYLSTYFPIQTIGPLAADPSVSFYPTFQVAAALSFGLLLLVSRLKAPRISGPPLTMGQVSMLVSAVGAVFIVLSYNRFGFDLVSLEDVYVRRSEVQYVDQLSGSSIVGYLYQWAATILAPYLIAVGIQRQSALLIIGGIAAEIFLFGVNANKTVILFPLFLIWIMMCTSRKFGYAMPAGRLVWLLALGVTGLAALDYLLATGGGEYLFYTSLASARLLINAGWMGGIYFSTFTNLEPGLYGDSIVGELLASVFGLESTYGGASTAQIIASLSFTIYGNPNVNFLSDAHAQLGFAGVAVIAFILAGLMYLADCLAVGRDRRLVLPLAALQGWALSNTGVLSLILTNGYILFLAVLWITPQADDSK